MDVNSSVVKYITEGNGCQMPQSFEIQTEAFTFHKWLLSEVFCSVGERAFQDIHEGMCIPKKDSV